MSTYNAKISRENINMMSYGEKTKVESPKLFFDIMDTSVYLRSPAKEV
jgi:hypothetical protein